MMVSSQLGGGREEAGYGPSAGARRAGLVQAASALLPNTLRVKIRGVKPKNTRRVRSPFVSCPLAALLPVFQ